MPTLVMMAKSAATGAPAAEYAGTSQKPIGQMAALVRKAMARMATAACSSIWSPAATAGMRMARSAMFSVPVTP